MKGWYSKFVALITVTPLYDGHDCKVVGDAPFVKLQLMPLREGIQGKNYTCHYPNYNSRPSARDISPLRNSYAVSSLLQRTPLCEGHPG